MRGGLSYQEQETMIGSRGGRGVFSLVCSDGSLGSCINRYLMKVVSRPRFFFFPRCVTTKRLPISQFEVSSFFKYDIAATYDTLMSMPINGGRASRVQLRSRPSSVMDQGLPLLPRPESFASPVEFKVDCSVHK